MLVETPPDKPVLIVNPTSGGGTASRYDLVGQCRARGIEPVVFERGDDLSALAASAIEDGADVIGMAGGDGSQGAVAAVAAEHDVPYVCVPRSDLRPAGELYRAAFLPPTRSGQMSATRSSKSPINSASTCHN